MMLVVEQGSMVFAWGETLQITHTAPDAHNPALARKKEDPNALTTRELETLARVVAGDSNPEIGARLGIDKRTATFHVTNLMRKLGAKNRVVLAVIAVRRGLVTAADGV